MFTTDSLFFLVLFVIPGAIKIIYDAKISKNPHRETDDRLRIACAFIFSVTVFSINSVLFQKLYSDFIAQENIFSDMSSLFRISIYNVIISLCCCFFLNVLIALGLGIRNYFAKKQRKSERILKRSPREAAFSEKAMGKGYQAVKVIKDGVEIVGLLDVYNETKDSPHEITLVYCKEISQYFKKDLFLPQEKQIFGKEKYTYVDLEHGYKIIFYDMEKYNQHYGQPATSLEAVEEDQMASLMSVH